MKNRIIGLILISIYLLLLNACAPIVRSDQPAHTGWIILDSGHSLGQTFTARYAGMEGIAFLIEPQQSAEGSLELNLYAYNQREIPLSSAAIVINPDSPTGFQRFTLGKISLSNQQDYYVRLVWQGTGKVTVGAGPGESYLNGAAYLDEVPQDQQTVFRLVYSPTTAARGLLLEGISWLLNLSLGLLLFVIPGWGILTILFPGWHDFFWAEKIGLAAGVSLAIYPILMVWTDLIGIHLGVFNAWIPIVPGISLMFWRFANRPHNIKSIPKPNIPNLLCNLAYAGVIAIILLTRLWPMRGLDAPMWGDGLQHTIITRLLVDHNGLFTNWAPYAELTSFTYHFGFHSLAAVFHWMTGMEASQAVLWTGQFVNVLSLLVLVPLANRLARNRWAGVIALAVAGLLTSIPQVYLNWGRYTQLAGQVILLVFVVLAWEYLENHSQKSSMAILVIGLLAGLALTHNRVSVFGAAFLVIYFLFNVSKAAFWRTTRSYLVIASGTLLLLLPWLVRTIPGAVTQLLVSLLTKPVNQLSETTTQAESILQFVGYIPQPIWYLSGIAIILGIFRRDKALLVSVFWWLLILLAGYPQWLGLPGYGALGGFTVMIAAYIPAAVLVSYLASQLLDILDKLERPRFNKPLLFGLVFAALFGLSIYNIRPRLQEIDPRQSALFTRADQRASEWINAHLPEDSLILINSFLAYDNTLAVGSDGGWWLPVKAHRPVTVPPINYVFEDHQDPTFQQRILELSTAVQDPGLADSEVQNMLREWGITHIYIGQQQGRVNNFGPTMTPEQLLQLDTFTPIYHEDRVWVFERSEP